MKKILIGMRGGIGDCVLFSSVLESFRERYSSEFFRIVAGTSNSCFEVVRSIPYIDDVIVDYRPRYVRGRSNKYFYKDRRTHLFIDDISMFFNLDHPYKVLLPQDRDRTHIIDLAASILGVKEYRRAGKVFVSDTNRDNVKDVIPTSPFVVFAPFCGQKIKIAPFGLMDIVAKACFEYGWTVYSIIPPSLSVDKNAFPFLWRNVVSIPSVLDVAAFLEKADYIVGLDSGISHIGAALGKPLSTFHIGYPVARSGVLSEKANIQFFSNRNISPDVWPQIVESVISHLQSSTRI